MKRLDASLVYASLVYSSLVYSSLAIAAMVALGGWVSMLPAHAAPPTVTPSPGYDARLQEQRNARTVYRQPLVSMPKQGSRRRAKPLHDRAH
jgi:hypothetical protein